MGLGVERALFELAECQSLGLLRISRGLVVLPRRQRRAGQPRVCFDIFWRDTALSPIGLQFGIRCRKVILIQSAANILYDPCPSEGYERDTDCPGTEKQPTNH